MLPQSKCLMHDIQMPLFLTLCQFLLLLLKQLKPRAYIFDLGPLVLGRPLQPLLHLPCLGTQTLLCDLYFVVSGVMRGELHHAHGLFELDLQGLCD